MGKALSNLVFFPLLTAWVEFIDCEHRRICAVEPPDASTSTITLILGLGHCLGPAMRLELCVLSPACWCAQPAREKESLAFEVEPHQSFDQWRKPEKEIFCFNPDQVNLVKKAMGQPSVTTSR